MFDFFKRRLKSEKGSMDSVLVTLLLIIVGLVVVGSLASWMSTQKTALKNDINSTLHKIVTE